MLIFKAAFSMDEACPHMQGSLVQTATRAIRFPVAAALPPMRRNPASLNDSFRHFCHQPWQKYLLHFAQQQPVARSLGPDKPP